ncbi:glycosyltransferase family 4 protein [Sphingomonas hengshuiensis]|uniref:glycosyltransferase family 4 protein n=1 Tax=Sphingomonas hengshuiensis TaxID=1609977 RepID=UPI000980B5F7|nr:glycosyltransferase family 4 protein [Sphingomonas hengshuiensis]
MRSEPDDRARPLVLVSANTAWNLAHFRRELVEALLADGYRVGAVAPEDGESSAALRAMGCVFFPVALDSAGAHPLRDLATFLALRRILRAERPVAWLSWTIKPNIYGAIAARLAGVAAFPNVSGLGTLFIRRTILTRLACTLYRLAFLRCPRVFFQNGDDCALFVRMRLVRAEQTQVLAGSGIDLVRFQPPPVHVPGRRFLLVARLLADKGVREFVAAARDLRSEWPDARFILMGAADVENRTAIPLDEVRGWEGEGAIEWRAPEPDVRPAMAAADWIVLPSYREGMSRVLLEALAMGRPIVTTNVPGCRDVVDEGENGFLAECRDVASLTAALRRAGTVDPAQWQAMARSSRAIAERRFSVATVIDAYRAVVAAAAAAVTGASHSPVTAIFEKDHR